ncbi:uncharacterized protein LOC141594242 [Silene latifolia]|uniref:uncharacterized protein LOC141594242 n=1 Tax=Silene latifolia TaxID=37657 RepID=UPI003D7834C4
MLQVLNYPCTLNCPSVKIMDIGVSETSQDFQLTAIDLFSLQEVNLMRLPTSCSSSLLMVVVKALFRLVENAEFFTLSFKAFERISSIERLEFQQNRWKSIVLYPWCNCESCLEVIIKLIRSSVKMEELKIYAGQSLGECELLCSELSTCVMPLLKTVTIHENHGYEKWCKNW